MLDVGGTCLVAYLVEGHPDACTEFATISDVPSAVLSKNSPCRETLATTTTVPTTTAPGETTTTAPGASTTSTP